MNFRQNNKNHAKQQGNSRVGIVFFVHKHQCSKTRHAFGVCHITNQKQQQALLEAHPD